MWSTSTHSGFDRPVARHQVETVPGDSLLHPILLYGCETWTLDPVTMRMINGANSKMLVKFTDKTIPQEARQTTCSFNLVRHIRIRRFKWLVHILRAGPSRLTYQAVEEQSRLSRPVNILMDAPPHTCFMNLMNLTVIASDRKAWRALAKKIM